MNSPHTELLPREQPGGSLLSGPTGPVARAGATCSWPRRWPTGDGGTNRCLRPVNSRADEYEADLSPDGRRLLFAQAQGEDSGELFLIDLPPGADPSWPPSCPQAAR